jgi:hypothetical protein
MKLSLLLLLPVASVAFAPVQLPSRVVPMRSSSLVTRNELDDACEKVTDTTEEYIGKADDLIVSRVMRVADHGPMIWTLKALADKAGMSATRVGICAAPATFTGLGTALAVPTWCFNVWALIAVAQVASVAKSALASDGNELSQADITAHSVANWVAARAIGSATPLRDTLLTAVVSGYALRKGHGSGDVNVHNVALQLMASFSTVLSVLGLVSAISARIPLLNGASEIVSLLGVASYYVMATRSDNGTIKKAVNAGVVAGMLYAAVSGGISVSMSVSSLLINVGLAGTVYVAYESVNRLRKAAFA